MSVKDIAQSPIHEFLQELIATFQNDTSGTLADYIPELAKANPDWFGISLATVDGHVYQVGESRLPFTIQSISKPFTYALALDTYGVDHALNKIGVEPSGEAFNEISLDEETGKPCNPMINAGAIATTGLIDGDTLSQRYDKIAESYAKFAGHPLELDESVYKSESETGFRNRAIAYLLKNSNIIEEKTEETLDLYFRQCSILVNCRDLAVMGATLANNGVNPITGINAVRSSNVEKVLSIMSTCGMYDYAGGWIYDIGMPAKSGVSGGIMAVLPGQFGLSIFSPLLDKQGNSIRGLKVCEKISIDFGLHMFDSSKASNSVIRAKHDATTVTSKRARSAKESDVLKDSGSKIKIYELAGDLIFSATDYVVGNVINELGDTDYMVIDFRRVTSAKKSTCNLISSLVDIIKQEKKQIFFVNTDYQFNKLLKKSLSRSDFDELVRFSNIDFALEWCENKLIETSIETTNIEIDISLSEQALLQNFNEVELKLLATLLEKRSFNKSAVIFSEGDLPDSLFFLTKGEVSIKVNGKKNEPLKRLSVLSAGMSFGEMSLLDRKNRSASVFAASEVECYELKFSIYDDNLELGESQIKAKLITNIAIDLSNKLRKANKEIGSYQ